MHAFLLWYGLRPLQRTGYVLFLLLGSAHFTACRVAAASGMNPIEINKVAQEGVCYLAALQETIDEEVATQVLDKFIEAMKQAYPNNNNDEQEHKQWVGMLLPHLKVFCAHRYIQLDKMAPLLPCMKNAIHFLWEAVGCKREVRALCEHVAAIHTAQAKLCSQEGQHKEAIHHYGEAKKYYETIVGCDSPSASAANKHTTNLAFSFYLGSPEDTTQGLQEMNEIYKKALEDTPSDKLSDAPPPLASNPQQVDHPRRGCGCVCM